MAAIPARRVTPGRPGLLVGVGLALLLSACAAGPGSPPAVTPAATEAEWRALAAQRQAPLTGAVRISVGDVQVVGSPPWAETIPSMSPLGLSELVAAGLLRRADVQFVERRRFTAAVEAERAGAARPRGAPAAGLSVGAEYVLSGVWITTPGLPASIELRLADTQTGAVAFTWRAPVPTDVDPVGLARGIVGGLVDELSGLGRMPAWDDPLPTSALTPAERAGVSGGGVQSFLRGLAAEELWDWESARLGYQAAIASDPTFFEASVALARAARLRQGGTLGES